MTALGTIETILLHWPFSSHRQVVSSKMKSVESRWRVLSPSVGRQAIGSVVRFDK
jgi:hypothetical protein